MIGIGFTCRLESWFFCNMRARRGTNSSSSTSSGRNSIICLYYETYNVRQEIPLSISWYVVDAFDGFRFLPFCSLNQNCKTIETKYGDAEDFDIRLGLVVVESSFFFLINPFHWTNNRHSKLAPFVHFAAINAEHTTSIGVLPCIRFIWID